jgi:hypothetical protein
MAKSKHNHHSNPSPASALKTWHLLAGLAVVAVIGGVIAFLVSSSSTSSYVPEVTGRPNLVVDKEVLDYGDVRFEAPVKAVFNVKNTGDEMLRILGEPRVEIVRGC